MMALNLKAMGYELARRLAAALPHGEPTRTRWVNLSSKPCTQADMESDWARHWCNELKTPLVFHRKLWELAYVLQALHDGGHIGSGQRGLGFGCGTEPIPSYLASRGNILTITDLAPEDARTAGWSRTDEYARTLDHAYTAHLVGREEFEQRVTLRYLDMNDIPDDLTGYDFCWSICALEHLGSIRQGLDFIENSLRTLRPGGTAVHTLEYNICPEGPTVDNWVTVLFQRRHIEEIAARLEAQGHTVAPLDFETGNAPMDQFIDLPPWPWQENRLTEISTRLGSLQLKVSIDGFPVTCFGIRITKAP
jgi:SAM-dependent methyltransferase